MERLARGRAATEPYTTADIPFVLANMIKSFSTPLVLLCWSYLRQEVLNVMKGHTDRSPESRPPGPTAKCKPYGSTEYFVGSIDPL